MVELNPTFNTAAELTKGQKTALKILEAAGRCIAQIGAEKTSITAIAKEAELKRSLIAYHFPKKEDIFYKVMVHIMFQFGRNFLPLRKMPSEPKAALSTLIAGYMDYFEEYPHYFHCYLHCFYLASVHERYRILNTKILQRILFRIQFAIKKLLVHEKIPYNSREIEDFSKVMYSNLVGTIMSYYTVVQDRPYEEFKQRCLKILDDEIELFLTYMRAQSQKAQ